jgi:hypothetical protein
MAVVGDVAGDGAVMNPVRPRPETGPKVTTRHLTPVDDDAVVEAAEAETRMCPGRRSVFLPAANALVVAGSAGVGGPPSRESPAVASSAASRSRT